MSRARTQCSNPTISTANEAWLHSMEMSTWIVARPLRDRDSTSEGALTQTYSRRKKLSSASYRVNGPMRRDVLRHIDRDSLCSTSSRLLYIMTGNRAWGKGNLQYNLVVRVSTILVDNFYPSRSPFQQPENVYWGNFPKDQTFPSVWYLIRSHLTLYRLIQFYGLDFRYGRLDHLPSSVNTLRSRRGRNAKPTSELCGIYEPLTKPYPRNIRQLVH